MSQPDVPREVPGKGESHKDDGGKAAEQLRPSLNDMKQSPAFSAKIDAQGIPAIKPDQAFATAKSQGDQQSADHVGRMSALAKVDLTDLTKAGKELSGHFTDDTFVTALKSVMSGTAPANIVEQTTKVATLVGQINDLKTVMGQAAVAQQQETLRKAKSA